VGRAVKAIRCDEMTWLAFGHVKWGSTVPPFAVLAGTLIRAEVIEPLPDGHRVKWFVSSPLYAEGPGDQRVMYFIHDDRMTEKSEPHADVWDAWLGCYLPDDEAVPVKVAVPEALQASAQEPYRSQRTATTTTAPQEAAAMTAKTTTATTTPDSPESKQADVEPRTKSTVGKEGTHKCPACKAAKAVTKFPTKRNAEGEYVRDLDACRECRDAARATRKAEREAAKATAA
jgi:hypothetical protein